MATIMLMHWREATPDEYDQAREKVGWDRGRCGYGAEDD
jgi:hypothetical protein